jgi:predicted alpha-1,2-mannosidase
MINRKRTVKSGMTRWILAGCLGLSRLCVGGPDWLTYVNTLQGTDSKPSYSCGNTYPTIAVPYPMHAFSPQTGKNGDGWKYQYSAEKIRGFQQVHQCSPWVNDYAVFSLMPVTGKLVVNEEERAASFSHSHETAKPHYYRVGFDNGITAEISPTERCGHMRFTFPADREAWLVFDGYTKTSGVHIDAEKRALTGYVRNGLLIPNNFKCYFILQFDQPFESFGTWENRRNTVTPGAADAEGEGVGAFIQFAPGTVVQVKTASSYISPEQADITFGREIGPHKTLEETRAEAAELWNALLGRVAVEGDSEADKATFYSCLFRANLFSHKFYEIDQDGRPIYFSPYDDKIYKGYMYTDNGFWDTFRSQFPLTNILHPTLQGRYMQSLLDAQQQYGWFPTWSCPGPSGIMIGNHAISLLADAWVKGIRTFDPEQALNAYFHEITGKGPWGGSNGREGFKEYFELGYIPSPDVSEAAAKTLEYAYDDFCGRQLARAVGNSFYEQVFARQMYNYRNVWDPSAGFMRGRKKDGQWLADFNPYRWGDPFTEGNSYQYTWSVFHDVRGLIQLMGGEQAFVEKLDSLFYGSQEYDVGSYGQVIHEISEMLEAGMGQYAHGNQPVQHVSYLYLYARQPWKTQHRIRQVMSRLYNATEKGYPGDEDQGGLSSWYVLSALGLYSVCPGTDQYVIGSPLFKKAAVTLENGHVFVIEAENNGPDNVYIESAWLNGKELSRSWITYDEIVQGGTLRFKMSSQPNYQRGIHDGDLPFSLTAILQ